MPALSLPFATLFLLFVMGSAFAGRLPFAVVFLYLGASAVAFFAYLLDKSAARNGQWRISENTLQMLGLVGGWPGALVAQTLLRHKTKKQSFQIVFWLTVLLNCCGLVWLFSPSGATALRLML
ncbi:MAG TPA: DUF1294 domain-containing protein [Geomonas sp.]